jgi:hypothetical protein
MQDKQPQKVRDIFSIAITPLSLAYFCNGMTKWPFFIAQVSSSYSGYQDFFYHNLSLLSIFLLASSLMNYIIVSSALFCMTGLEEKR